MLTEEQADYAGILGQDAADALQRVRDRQAEESDYAAICAGFFARTYPVSRYEVEREDGTKETRHKIEERKTEMMDWIAERYLHDRHNGGQIKLEDLYKIGDRLQYFTGLKHSGAIAAHDNPVDYPSLADLDKRLAPFEARRRQKEEERLKRHMPPEQRARIMAESNVLYSGKAGSVVAPQTPAASRYWGNGTKWCISGEDGADQYFPGYHERNPIVMFLPARGEKMALADDTFWDPADHSQNTPNADVGALLEEMARHVASDVMRSLQALHPRAAPVTPAFTACAANDNDAAAHLTAEEKQRVEEIINAAKACESVNKIADDIRKNKKLVLAAVRQDGGTLRFAAPALREDKEVVLAAVQENGWALRFAAPALREDKEVVLAAIQQDGAALRYAAPTLREDKEVVLAAVQQDGGALGLVAPALREDKEVVLAAVQQNGGALRFAAPALREDKEVVLAAMQENGYALRFAAPALRKDKEVVLAAVQQDGWALKCAAPALQADKEVVLAAVQKNGGALEFAAPALRNDPALARYALDQGEPELVLQIYNTGLPLEGLSDEEILEGQIRALQTLLDEGRDDIAKQNLRHIKTLWGQGTRIFENPREQLAWLQEKTAAPQRAAAPYPAHGFS